jgi:sulfate adenylyltransferase
METTRAVPHGGELVELLAGRDRAAIIAADANSLPSWDLTPRQTCDLELLINGAFSPLRGFLCRADYECVLERMRLEDGSLWPIPVVLDLPEPFAGTLHSGDRLALRDSEGLLLGVLSIEELWRADREREAEKVYKTTDTVHPGARYLQEHTNPVYAGGRIEGVQLPPHYDFRLHRRTPAELRSEFERLGWKRVVAFQTRNPLHRAHFELTRRAAIENDANLLIHPVVGMTKPGDLDHYTRVRCYEALLHHYHPQSVMLSLLPLSMRMAGARSALWHALIRKNYGCTHFIVGRDHAGPGVDRRGSSFYGPYEAQELLRAHQEELGISVVPFRSMVYLEEQNRYVPDNEVPRDIRGRTISGTELKRILAEGESIPSWFTFPEVADELRKSHPPRNRRGFTVFFTGLSGAGKSTIANVLRVKLLEMGGRPVTLLDGDVVRKYLSSELGFSKRDRDINIRRIGFVASEITKNGGIAICAPIAPYDATRRDVRAAIEPCGSFVLVYVSTPVSVCEGRDRKGLYAKARAGLIPEFTGVSDPYEAPEDAEVVIDTTELTPEHAADKILDWLRIRGCLDSALRSAGSGDGAAGSAQARKGRTAGGL